MSYIEREAVLELIQEAFHKTDVNGEEQIGVLKCHRIVREASTADVVEIVRCKDCKCFEPHGNGKFGLCKNKKFKGIRAEIDYCSYGERREETK